MSILRTTTLCDLPARTRRQAGVARRSQPTPFQTTAERALSHATSTDPGPDEVQEEFVWTFPEMEKKPSSGTPSNKGRSVGAKLALKP